MPIARQPSLIASPSSSPATSRRRSSIPEHAFHGIQASPGKGKGVTHVSGTICHLCLGPLTAANQTSSMRVPKRKLLGYLPHLLDAVVDRSRFEERRRFGRLEGVG